MSDSGIIVGDSEKGPVYEGFDPDAPMDPEPLAEAAVEIDAIITRERERRRRTGA